jgi:hypothetical protein
MSWLRLSLALAARSLVDPKLGLNLVTVAWRFRKRDWYRHAPFIPIPDPVYLKWRMYTTYGDFDAVPEPDEVVRYARWACENE